jgi:cytochrome P450
VIDHGLPPAAAPGFAAAWIEETLRHDGPVHQATRIATEDLVLAGQRIARGDRIVLLIGAAHRDARRFAQPEAFRPDRTDQDVLGFGAGLHHCLGAQMARIEAQSAITLLAHRLDRPTRTARARQYWQHRTLRRIATLPATVLPESKKDPRQCQR